MESTIYWFADTEDEPYGVSAAAKSPASMSPVALDLPDTDPPPPQPPTSNQAANVLSKPGTIAGIVIGSIALLCLLALAAVAISYQRRRHTVAARGSAGPSPRPAFSNPEEFPQEFKGRVPVVQPNGEVCIGITCEQTRQTKGFGISDLLVTDDLTSTPRDTSLSGCESSQITSLQDTGNLQIFELEDSSNRHIMVSMD